jgi:hypothetical protein
MLPYPICLRYKPPINPRVQAESKYLKTSPSHDVLPTWLQTLGLHKNRELLDVLNYASVFSRCITLHHDLFITRLLLVYWFRRWKIRANPDVEAGTWSIGEAGSILGPRPSITRKTWQIMSIIDTVLIELRWPHRRAEWCTPTDSRDSSQIAFLIAPSHWSECVFNKLTFTERLVYMFA